MCNQRKEQSAGDRCEGAWPLPKYPGNGLRGDDGGGPPLRLRLGAVWDDLYGRIREKRNTVSDLCSQQSEPPAVSSNTLQTPVIQPILLITLFPWRCGHPLGQARFPLYCEGCRRSQRPTGVSQSSYFPPRGHVCLLAAETRRSGATANQQSSDSRETGRTQEMRERSTPP